MDKEILKEWLKALLPIVLFFAFMYQTTPPIGDYVFHLYNGQGQATDNLFWSRGVSLTYAAKDYPQGVSWIMGVLGLALDRRLAIFLLMLTASVVLPYLLIYAILKREKKPWALLGAFVYLYGSGVPFILMQDWYVPQAIIQVFMLASILYEPILFPFLWMGPLIHREAYIAIGITIFFIALLRWGHKVRWLHD